MSILSALIPTSGLYKAMAMIGITLAVGIGGFFYGKHYGDEQSKVVIADYDVKLQKLTDNIDAIQLEVVDKIITVYETQVVHIKDVGTSNEQVIIKYVPDHGFLSNGWVYAHNASAAGNLIDPASATDGTPSTFTATDALTTVNNNYTTCLATNQELIGLQSFINEYNDAIKKANENVKKGK